MPCFLFKIEKEHMPKLVIFSSFNRGGILFMETRDKEKKAEEWCHEILSLKSWENEKALVEFWWKQEKRSKMKV